MLHIIYHIHVLKYILCYALDIIYMYYSIYYVTHYISHTCIIVDIITHYTIYIYIVSTSALRVIKIRLSQLLYPRNRPVAQLQWKRECSRKREREKRKSARQRKVFCKSVGWRGVAWREVGLGRAGQGRVQKSIVVFTRRPRRDAAGFRARVRDACRFRLARPLQK